ncbi:MAG: hypothetical protein WC980_07835, partial [Candidatus Brocadiia bacterium]
IGVESIFQGVFSPQNSLISATYSPSFLCLKCADVEQDDIHKLSKIFSAEKMPKLIDLWYEGLIKQLTNLSPDIMIEKWLYDTYPNLRHYQLQSIQKQHKDAMVGLSDEVSKMTPKKVFDACNTMNYAFFRILGLHVETNFIRPYNNSGYISKGKELAKITEENYADSYEGDIQMINKWAAFLDLKHWFEWTDFENVPAGYPNV